MMDKLDLEIIDGLEKRIKQGEHIKEFWKESFRISEKNCEFWRNHYYELNSKYNTILKNRIDNV